MGLSLSVPLGRELGSHRSWKVWGHWATVTTTIPATPVGGRRPRRMSQALLGYLLVRPAGRALPREVGTVQPLPLPVRF